jgi:hypothetical protein
MREALDNSQAHALVQRDSVKLLINSLESSVFGSTHQRPTSAQRLLLLSRAGAARVGSCSELGGTTTNSFVFEATIE